MLLYHVVLSFFVFFRSTWRDLRKHWMFHPQKNPIRRLHVAAQTNKNELLYLTKSRYKFLMVHVCSFRISWHLFKNSDTQGLASVWLFSHYQQKKEIQLFRLTPNNSFRVHNSLCPKQPFLCLWIDVMYTLHTCVGKWPTCTNWAKLSKIGVHTGHEGIFDVLWLQIKSNNYVHNDFLKHNNRILTLKADVSVSSWNHSQGKMNESKTIE